MDRKKSLLDPVKGIEGGTLKISIFMPTHHKEPDNRTDAIVFKNLLKELEEKLKGYPEQDRKKILTALSDIQKETLFWNQSKAGLGILATPQEVEVYRLGYAVAPSVKVGETFHILPLLKYLEGTADAYLADLSRDRISLYYFDGAELARVSPEGLEQEFTDLFNDYDPGSTSSSSPSGGGQASVYHSSWSKSEEDMKEREKYFRYLDERFSKLLGAGPTPMVLAGTKDNLAAFRDYAKGDFYTKEAIEQPLESMNPNAILAELMRIMDYREKKESENTSDNAAVAVKNNLAESDLAKIAKLATEGRVSELLIKESVIAENTEDLDDIIRDLFATGGRVRLLKDFSASHEEPVLAVLRY